MSMWPKKAQHLDRILHSTLLTLMSGPKPDYIRNVDPKAVFVHGALQLMDQ